MLERINFYDGGVVTFAKNLSDQGKTIKEILEEIQIQFPNLPGGIKGLNKRIQGSDFGKSKTLADFLRTRKQKNEAASRKTRDEARQITRRLSKQKPTPQDRGRGSMPTRTSRPSPSRRSSSSYTEAARARRR